MHLPKRWWIGLPILAGLAYLANDNLTPQFEAALRARIVAQLAKAPGAVDNPQITVNGRDVSVAGVALSPEFKDRVFAMLVNESGARVLNDATQPLVFAKPFVLKLERRGGKVAISGNVPVSDWRERLRGEIAAMGFELSDGAAFAQGAPGNFSQIAGFAVKRLAELDPAEVTLTDATLSLRGEARSADDYDKAMAALQASPLGGNALKADVSPPRITPYVFSAKLGDGVIALSGHLPSDDLRKQVVAMAAQAAAGAAVSDGTKLGAGAPSGDYAAALAFSVAELAKLSHGKVTFADGKIAIEGEGRENVLPATLESDAKAHLPHGFELTRLEVAAGPVSPYVFNAERHNNEVTLSGYAPDDATRARLVEAARKNFFDAAVVDRLTIARGAPSSFAEAADRSLGALARLAEGRLAVSGGAITLTGVARHDAARRDIERALSQNLPQSFHSEAFLQTHAIGSRLDIAQCNAALGALMTKGTIRFGAEDSTLAPESAPLIDAIAATALRCDGASIEIGGYTDNSGIPEVNAARSKRRAQAIADALVRAGAESFRVSGVGYGAERPVAANDSDENRARNNRVEIVAK